MKFINRILEIWEFAIKTIKDFLVPENKKIEGILKMEAHTMRLLLPKSPINSKNIFVLFDYRNKIVRLLVKAIKYKNNENIRKRIAQYLYEDMVDIFSDIALFEGSAPIFMPMPMSKKEKTKRGFNQCEELAREIKKIAGENLEVRFDALKKVRETERQTNLDKKQPARAETHISPKTSAKKRRTSSSCWSLVRLKGWLPQPIDKTKTRSVKNRILNRNILKLQNRTEYL